MRFSLIVFLTKVGDVAINSHQQLSFLSLLTVMAVASSAYGMDTSIDTSLNNLPDVSMFNDAVVNSGIENQLEGGEQHYTIFAPTNADFKHYSSTKYPCLYSVECRPMVAALVRDHVILGKFDLEQLVAHGSGMQSASTKVLHIEEPFVGDYTVEGHKILSKTESDGNVIYRIDDIIASPQQMSVFKTVNYTPSAEIVTDQQSVTTFSPDAELPEDVTRKTAIIQHSVVEQ